MALQISTTLSSGAAAPEAYCKIGPVGVKPGSGATRTAEFEVTVYYNEAAKTAGNPGDSESYEFDYSVDGTDGIIKQAYDWLKVTIAKYNGGVDV